MRNHAKNKAPEKEADWLHSLRKINMKDVKLFWNRLVQGNWSGVLNFHSMEMSLVMSM